MDECLDQDKPPDILESRPQPGVDGTHLERLTSLEQPMDIESTTMKDSNNEPKERPHVPDPKRLFPFPTRLDPLKLNPRD